MPASKKAKPRAFIRSSVVVPLRKTSTGVPLIKGQPPKKNTPEPNAKPSQGPSTATAPKVQVRSNEKAITFNDSIKVLVSSQWGKKDLDLEDAPEIRILRKMDCSNEANEGGKCCSKLLKIFQRCCKISKFKLPEAFGQGQTIFKPVCIRTIQTMDYVGQLKDIYSKLASAVPAVPGSAKNIRSAGASKTTTKHNMASKSSAMSRVQKARSKYHILRDFYGIAYEALQYLQKGISAYKETILGLTFTKHAEYQLTHSEVKLTQGRSIVGSCMWIVTCALKQLQEDPELQQFDVLPANKKSNSRLSDIAMELLVVTNMSIDTWDETIQTIRILERIHFKTEECFRAQTFYLHSSFDSDSEEAIAASVHLKRYRRPQLIDVLDTRKGLKTTPNTRPKTRIYPRILYKVDYVKPSSIWTGFDPLPAPEKLRYLTEVLRFVRTVLHSVKESAQKVAKLLQGSIDSKKFELKTRSWSKTGLAGITCYEKGITLLDEMLKKNSVDIQWTPDETTEFFEIDKVFLDDVDVLTLGAGITRSLLYDVRHTVHVCYETCRFLNFNEFLSLPEYDKLQKTFYSKEEKKRTSIDEFDAEEVHVNAKHLSNLFRNSPYCEVAKILPIYCGRVGLTLQDADLVFTPSSEKILIVKEQEQVGNAHMNTALRQPEYLNWV